MNYPIHHVQQFGHGKLESNNLAEDKKVKIIDHDGFIDVYECETNEEAQKIAAWYISAVYQSYPGTVELVKNSDRLFSIEVLEVGN
jgi:hypothetical protein